MKTLAFDSFLQETGGEMIEVRVRGLTFRIPCQVPALVPLMLSRAERMPEAERGPAYTRLLFEAAELLFGQEELDRLCRTGITSQDLTLLLQKCFEMIAGTDGEEGEELTDEGGRRSLPAQGKK